MEKDLRSKVISGLFWSVTQAWFNQAIALVVFVILARLLIPEDFGIVAIAGILIGILGLFVQQGFATAIIQRQDLEPGHLNAAFWLNLSSGVIFAAIALLAAAPIGHFYGSDELVWVIRLLSLNLIILSLTEVQRALLRKYFRFRKLAIRTLVATGAGGVVGVILAFQGFGAYSLVGQQLTNNLVALLALWVVTAWMPGTEMAAKHFRDLWGFGLKLLGASLLNIIRRRMDVLILSVFFGPVAVGYYAVALKPISMVVTMFTKVVSNVALPAFSTLQESPERLAGALLVALKLVAVVLLPVVVVLFFYGEFIILSLFGDAWENSAGMLKILAFWGLIQSVLMISVQSVYAKGRPGLVLLATGAIAVACPLAMLLAVPLGIEAVIVANVAGTFVVGGGFLVVVSRLVGFSWRRLAFDLRGPALGAVGLAIVSSILVDRSGMDNLRAVIGIISGLILYGAILLALERHTLGRFLQELKTRPRKAAIAGAQESNG